MEFCTKTRVGSNSITRSEVSSTAPSTREREDSAEEPTNGGLDLVEDLDDEQLSPAEKREKSSQQINNISLPSTQVVSLSKFIVFLGLT